MTAPTLDRPMRTVKFTAPCWCGLDAEWVCVARDSGVNEVRCGCTCSRSVQPTGEVA